MNMVVAAIVLMLCVAAMLSAAIAVGVQWGDMGEATQALCGRDPYAVQPYAGWPSAEGRPTEEIEGE